MTFIVRSDRQKAIDNVFREMVRHIFTNGTRDTYPDHLLRFDRDLNLIGISADEKQQAMWALPEWERMQLRRALRK